MQGIGSARMPTWRMSVGVRTGIAILPSEPVIWIIVIHENLPPLHAVCVAIGTPRAVPPLAEFLLGRIQHRQEVTEQRLSDPQFDLRAVYVQGAAGIGR